MAIPLSGYVRVSQVGGREGEGFISPEVQEQAIREWSERTGIAVVIERHELDVSGGTMDRPVFNGIMDKIRTGKSGGIVVYKLDRFARTLLGAVTTLAELGEHDAVLASTTEPELDYTTPSGKAFMQQMFVFAEFVRSTLKESWATAQRHAIERGIHISPAVPLGYSRGDDGRLVPDADAPIAVEVFRRRGRGETWNAIAGWLNEAAPRPDGMRWNGGKAQRLCAKRVYRGEASRYVDQDVDGRGPIVNPTAHPALVTEQEWQAAQMDPRAATGGGANGNPGPLLQGLIRCAGCRYAMSKGTAHGAPTYRCRRDHASGRCGEPAMILMDVIEEHVESAVLDTLDGMARIVPDSNERDRAVAELDQARADLDGFKRDREARRKLGAEWHEWLDTYLAAVRDAETAVAVVDQQLGVVREGLTRDHYLSLPVDDRREVLAGFIDCVFVRKSVGRGVNVDPTPDRTRILWRGQGPADLPRRRRANVVRPFRFDEYDVEAGIATAQDASERVEASATS